VAFMDNDRLLKKTGARAQEVRLRVPKLQKILTLNINRKKFPFSVGVWRVRPRNHGIFGVRVRKI